MGAVSVDAGETACNGRLVPGQIESAEAAARPARGAKRNPVEFGRIFVFRGFLSELLRGFRVWIFSRLFVLNRVCSGSGGIDDGDWQLFANAREDEARTPPV